MVGDVYQQTLNPLTDPTVQTVVNPCHRKTPLNSLPIPMTPPRNRIKPWRTSPRKPAAWRFYNNNDIMRAVALSSADGGRYYTLGYYPEAARWDGKFHSIDVKINRDGVKSRHRSGYFAVDAAQSSASETPQQRDRRAYDELRSALSDPLSATQVTFRVYIPAPERAAHPQVQIQFLVDASAISFDPIENDLHHCNLDFMVAAVSLDGKVIASDAHTVDARLKPDQFAQANQNGLPFSMQLTAGPRNIFSPPRRPRQPNSLDRHPNTAARRTSSLNSDLREETRDF